MVISLSNFTEKLHNGKCEHCKCYLEYVNTKNGLLIFKCVDCNRNFEQKFVENLMKQFAYAYRFCNGNINTFGLILLKYLEPYECLDSWQIFDETSLRA